MPNFDLGGDNANKDIIKNHNHLNKLLSEVDGGMNLNVTDENMNHIIKENQSFHRTIKKESISSDK